MSHPDSIVEALYGPPAQTAIRQLWENPADRESLRRAMGEEIARREDLVLVNPSLDLLFLICATSQFADDEEECQAVAAFTHRSIARMRGELPLPSLLDPPLPFAIKTLTSLSFFFGAMVRRHERRGAPGPDFYRDGSCHRFRMLGYCSIARHHREWENFLAERLGA